MMNNVVQFENYYKNGYTRISNETLEALAATKLNGTQRRILDVIFRYTYGFQRDEHNLSVTFIGNATNINSREIKRELKKLFNMNIIKEVQKATFSSARSISFNLEYSTWLLNKNQVVNTPPGDNKTTQPDGESDTSIGGELTTQERKKENIKEMSTSATNDDLFDSLWEKYPIKKGKVKVSKESKKAIYKIGKERMMHAIENYKAELEDNSWKQPMYGNTFFNGGYEDYLQDQEGFNKQCASENAMTNKEIDEYYQSLDIQIQ